MRKLLFVIILLLVSTVTGCNSNELSHIGLKELGIDKSKGHVNCYINTHGGFHGDGCTYAEIAFVDKKADDVEKELKDNNKWKKLPLSKNLQTAVYRDEDTQSFFQSFEEEIPTIPKITNGYYYFKDRHSESTDSKDDTNLYSRYSFNFDIIIYDMDKHLLYIFQLDT